MREIKFRAWFEPEEEYIYDVQATYDNTCRGKGSLYHESFGEVLEDEDCIIEQYTGLKDRLGKEIYEGDIVKFNETICTVQFNEEYAKYTLRDQSDGVILGFDALIITPFEIIGNIHENPELLKEEE